MIDETNLHRELTGEMRRTALQRAVYTCPYFYRMPVEYLTTVKNPRFSSVLGINNDFFLTEMQSNFGETKENAGVFFNAAVYTGYSRSVYQYVNIIRKIPSGLIFEEARQSFAAVGTHFFVDRQEERLPFLIRRNDKIYADIEAAVVPNQSGFIDIIFKGFNVLPTSGLTPTETDQCNASLAKDVEWQYFKFNINDSDKPSKQYIIENDNKPRILLGFGAQNGGEHNPTVEVTITDITRRLRLTDTAIPLQYIAPKVPNCQDTHIYYLPTEYYLEPYAKLQFDVAYTQDVAFSMVEISALTRTV